MIYENPLKNSNLNSLNKEVKFTKEINGWFQDGQKYISKYFSKNNRFMSRKGIKFNTKEIIKTLKSELRWHTKNYIKLGERYKPKA